MLKKIVSGAQTGVDRSALDAAIELDYAYGGWCPRGRRAEDGVIDPVKYSNLQETSSDRYPQRTEANVRDSDGTLIIVYGDKGGRLSAGTQLTADLAEKHHKPLLIVNLKSNSTDVHETQVIEWVTANHIGTLNVAGPRESTTPGIYMQARTFLQSVFRKMKC